MNLTPDVPLNNMETLSVQMIPEPAANVPSCMRDFPMIYVKGLVTTACLVLDFDFVPYLESISKHAWDTTHAPR